MTFIEDSMIVESIDDASNREIGLAWVNTSPKSSTKKADSSSLHDQARIHAVPIGNSLISLLQDLVDSSKEMVCLSSFLLQGSEFTNSLTRARERGVRVYVLTAGEEDLKITDEDGSPSVQRVKEFRQLLSTLSGKVFLRSADFHAKFVISDPLSKQAKGIMTTANLTTDALSGVNEELYAELSTEEVNSFFYQFLVGVWKMSRHELKDGVLRELEEDRYLPDQRIPLPTHPATLLGTKTLYEMIKNLISEARREILISAWTFSDEVEIPGLLSQALDRGVMVTAYARPNYLNGITLSKLKEKGAHILAHDRFHAKAIIVDGRKAIVTTANFAKHGLEDGFEAGIVIGSPDVKALTNIFIEWGNKCDWTLSLTSKISSLEVKVKLVDKDIQDTREVVVRNEEIVSLPVIRLREIKNKEEIKLEIPDYPRPKDLIVKRKIYRSKVSLPQLPKGSSRVDETEGRFGVYKLETSKELFVPISEWEDLDAAREVAKKYGAKVVRSTMQEQK